LLEVEVVGQDLGETFLVHSPDDVHADFGIGVKFGLAEEAVGAVGAAGVVCIEADAVLAGPTDEAVVVGELFHGSVGDGGSGAEEDEAELTDGDGNDALLVLEGERFGVFVEAAVFEVEVAPSVGELGEGMEVFHPVFSGSDWCDGEESEAVAFGGANACGDGSLETFGVDDLQEAFVVDADVRLLVAFSVAFDRADVSGVFANGDIERPEACGLCFALEPFHLVVVAEDALAFAVLLDGGIGSEAEPEPTALVQVEVERLGLGLEEIVGVGLECGPVGFVLGLDEDDRRFTRAARFNTEENTAGSAAVLIGKGVHEGAMEFVGGGEVALNSPCCGGGVEGQFGEVHSGDS
jgi:hypothetical protein